MSSSSARDIPKRNEPTEDVPTQYSTTPSGTMYTNTPGGSRIVYDRNTLLDLAKSPFAKTPPTKLAFVPGVTKVHTTNEGHLAPPANVVFAGASQRRQEETDDDGAKDRHGDGPKSSDEDGSKSPARDGLENAQKETHDQMFEMDDP